MKDDIEVEVEVEIVTKAPGADGVEVLELRDPAGNPLPQWEPGAHIDVQLSPGITRQYSLCGDPADGTRWRIAVLRESAGRGGSQFVHDKLAAGDRIRIRGPRNHFQLLPASNHIFVAGGIGITPIMTMAYAAQAAGTRFTLVYGGRSRSSMAFVDELIAGIGDRLCVRPQDEVGLIDLPSLFEEVQADTLVYCCGPAPLLDAVTAATEHWPGGSLHLERFSAKELSEPSRTDSFEVELVSSGMVVTVPADVSILDAVSEAGVSVLSSCREGTCGTCETTVLAGSVEHRDSLLSPEEQQADDTMMICVSRATSDRLTLDL